jgi:hypothetical protein
MLATAILAGLSVKVTVPLKCGVKINFDIKGVVVMGVISIATSCLASAGICEGGRGNKKSGMPEAIIYGVKYLEVQVFTPSSFFM